MKIVFATGNKNKVAEARQILGNQYELLSLVDIGCTEEVPETQATLEGNAIQKAQYVVDNYQLDCFSEDAGLEVFALDNAPGVYSARYAGPQRNHDDNMDLLLQNLEGKSNRAAQFRAVIALHQNGTIHTFEGIVKGKIISERRGTDGFGYDPIFVPDGYETTFAEMTKAEKAKISHRGQAVRKLMAFLKE